MATAGERALPAARNGRRRAENDTDTSRAAVSETAAVLPSRREIRRPESAWASQTAAVLRRSRPKNGDALRNAAASAERYGVVVINTHNRPDIGNAPLFGAKIMSVR